MADIHIRPFQKTDLPALMEIDHSYTTAYVWQMDISTLEREYLVSYREIRLPREMEVEYPRHYLNQSSEWEGKENILVAYDLNSPVGYITLMKTPIENTLLVSGLAVNPSSRRSGFGTGLIYAGLQWAKENQYRFLQLEMQSKNYPAIKMAQKIGFDFSGYSDKYFINQDIALFFTKHV
ncbi:MAG: GNAT family N-acetyltransferase [Anaerolineales bacterium]|nr:GNAT family N-acetyltransferase [Anaerolineales bacterium]